MFLTQRTIAISLLICFFATTRATRFREDVKRRFEANFKAGGQRNWLQIVCNLGIANVATLALLISSGFATEAEVDFTRDYDRSWYLLAALGAISCALGDTLSSELGPVLAEDVEPMLITTFQTGEAFNFFFIKLTFPFQFRKVQMAASPWEVFSPQPSVAFSLASPPG